MTSKVYIIPAPLHEESVNTIPGYITEIIPQIRNFIVEDERSARQFLKKIIPSLLVQECNFFVLNEHTHPQDAEKFFKETFDTDVGLLSEAGCACVADPGSSIVLLAHQMNKEVIPLVGPSSILLALMASGLNGQNFAFLGYLPKDRNQRLKKLKELEEFSFQQNQTQIFMETPYHNQTLFGEIISTCAPETLFCVAVDLTSPTQYIKTLTIREWQKSAPPPLHKKPALFLIYKRNKSSRN